MLKRLRIQFVAVIMVIVTVMLALLFGMLYSSTRRTMANESVSMMRSIAENSFQPVRPDDSSGELRLPYFVLQIGNQGELTATGGGYYDLSDEDFLKALIQAVFDANESTGVIEAYNLRFYRAVIPSGQRLVFADMTSEQSTLRGLLKNCIALGILCFLAFLGVSILLAFWMVRPVDKAWKQQRRFVADASHELKTPLTVIMANTELLQCPDCDDESKKQCSDSILMMSRQMRELVERLLELARTDKEQSETALSDLDFSSLVEKALLPFDPVFFEKGLRLVSRIRGGVTVEGNAPQLRQLMDILLDNAQKYAAVPGEIAVCLERVNRRRCRLSVANPGAEISGEDLKNIFKRFFRADEARSRDGGFGLGLSIAESIVQAHHGRIWAESENGMVTFYVELPRSGNSEKMP